MEAERGLRVAYLAGVIDADGYISVNRAFKQKYNRAYYSIIVGIAGTRPAPHNLAKEMWGGNTRRFKNGNSRPQWQWYCYGAKALPVLKEVSPHLRIKGRQATLAVLAQEAQQAGAMTPDLWEQVWCRVVELNEARHRLNSTSQAMLRVVEARS